MTVWAHWRDVLDHTDPATADLILSLQYEDANTLAHASGDDFDLTAALSIFEQELQHCNAVQKSINGGAFTPLVATAQPANKRARSLSDTSQGDDKFAPGPKRVKTTEPAQNERGSCSACGDAVSSAQLWTNTCSHAYCAECLEQVYRLAMIDESVYPPSCCQQSFVYQELRSRLAAELVQDFEAKREELEIKDRLYCADPHCSAYISIAERSDAGGTCPKCSAVTCTKCKNSKHDGECPTDEALQAVLTMAGKEEWQRCPTCSSMIELTRGCNHITCKCRAEFCYVCTAKWRSCECPRWYEHRLLERAERIEDRTDEVRTAEERRVAVRARMQLLRGQADCGHDFLRIEGGDRCEDCNDELDLYIFECRTCLVRVCRWCMDWMDGHEGPRVRGRGRRGEGRVRGRAM